jgi:hypothetical protein
MGFFEFPGFFPNPGLSTLNEFIPAPLAETNERSSATEKGTWIDLKELIMKNLTDD